MMKNSKKIILALAGFLSLALFHVYIMIGTAAPFWQYLTLKMPIDHIVKEAESNFQKSNNGTTFTIPDIDYNFDKDLLSYVQENKVSFSPETAIDIASNRSGLPGKN